VKKFAPLAEQRKPEVQDKTTEDDVPDIEYMPPTPKGRLPRYLTSAKKAAISNNA
jgi:hypothetical protein